MAVFAVFIIVRPVQTFFAGGHRLCPGIPAIHNDFIAFSSKLLTWTVHPPTPGSIVKRAPERSEAVHTGKKFFWGQVRIPAIAKRGHGFVKFTV
jgi:hypothetical protein